MKLTNVAEDATLKWIRENNKSVDITDSMLNGVVTSFTKARQKEACLVTENTIVYQWLNAMYQKQNTWNNVKYNDINGDGLNVVQFFYKFIREFETEEGIYKITNQNWFQTYMRYNNDLVYRDTSIYKLITTVLVVITTSIENIDVEVADMDTDVKDGHINLKFFADLCTATGNPWTIVQATPVVTLVHINNINGSLATFELINTESDTLLMSTDLLPNINDMLMENMLSCPDYMWEASNILRYHLAIVFNLNSIVSNRTFDTSSGQLLNTLGFITFIRKHLESKLSWDTTRLAVIHTLLNYLELPTDSFYVDNWNHLPIFPIFGYTPNNDIVLPFDTRYRLVNLDESKHDIELIKQLISVNKKQVTHQYYFFNSILLSANYNLDTKIKMWKIFYPLDHMNITTVDISTEEKLMLCYNILHYEALLPMT